MPQSRCRKHGASLVPLIDTQNQTWPQVNVLDLKLEAAEAANEAASTPVAGGTEAVRGSTVGGAVASADPTSGDRAVVGDDAKPRDAAPRGPPEAASSVQ